MSLVVDLVAFEMVPALAYGSMGLFLRCCNCKGWLCLLVGIEEYRLLRNLAA